MTLSTQVLVFLAAIPLAVWMLATFCALLDEPGTRSNTLMRLITAACGVLIFTLLTNRSLLEPVLWASALVVVLHIVANWGFRLLLLGVPIYTDEPPQREGLTAEFPPGADEKERAYIAEEQHSSEQEKQ